MEEKKNPPKSISRRAVLPLLGGSILTPFLSFGQQGPNDRTSQEEDDYKTLLKPDGTTVKVHKDVLKNAKVVKKNVSNSAFFKWLDKKQ